MTLDFRKLERDGFCLASGISHDSLLDFVQELGQVKVDSRSPEPVREIRPQAVELAKSNTLSSRYGTGKFPFHTDAAHWEDPARYLVLFCVSPGEGMRPTLLQDSLTWWFDDAEKALACQALWAVGHRRPRLSSIAQQSHGEFMIRYDLDCMRPMTAEARHLKLLIENRIESQRCIRIDWSSGSLLAIDNHRMAHARGEAERPDPNRVLKRILIGGS